MSYACVWNWRWRPLLIRELLIIFYKSSGRNRKHRYWSDHYIQGWSQRVTIQPSFEHWTGSNDRGVRISIFVLMLEWSGPQGQHITKFREMHSQAEIGEDGHQLFVAAYDGSQASLYDEMGRKYNRLSEEPYSSGTNRQLTCVSPGSNYRAKDLEERLTSRITDNFDSLSYRQYHRGRRWAHEEHKNKVTCSTLWATWSWSAKK